MKPPAPPDFAIDWSALDFPWIERMRGVPQDPIHHAEGDVWIHTRLVCEAMAALPAFRAANEEARAIAFAGALLHDVSKPDTTRAAEGRVTAKGHSTRGAIAARVILWRMGIPFEAREEIVALVRHHQAPFWLLEREDPELLVARISQTARCALLAWVAEADARGRTCADQQRILDNVALFSEFAREKDCLETPYAFPSDHARFLCFQNRQIDPSYRPHEQFRCEAILMSGLPGAGKDRIVKERFGDRPVVSLDEIRRAMKVDPGDDQGTVVQTAREQAREHLRAGRSFVWNATNLSHRLRALSTRLFSDYDARIRIVYVEAPEAVVRAQNRARDHVVPEGVMDDLLEKWEVPDLTECHEIERHIRRA